MAVDDAQRGLELAVFTACAVSRHPLPAQRTISIGRSAENAIRDR